MRCEFEDAGILSNGSFYSTCCINKGDVFLNGKRLCYGCAYKQLVSAAKALYYAGHWSCDGGVDADKLWADLRDALGLPLGTSPVRRIT